jgi:hypothetical protein
MTRHVARGLLVATFLAAGASSIANAHQPRQGSELSTDGDYSVSYASPNQGSRVDRDDHGAGRESCSVAVGAVLRKAQAPAAVGVAVVPHTRSRQNLDVASVAVSR